MPPDNDIALTLMVGDDVPAPQWTRLMDSVIPYVQGLYIQYNGTQASFPYTQYEIKKPFVVERFEWCHDFSAARNANMAMVPREHYRWMLWLDGDDELVDGHRLPELLKTLKPTTQGVHFPYDYAWDIETGEVVIQQWRERLLRTDCQWVWHYRIHEVCHSPAGVKHTRRDQVSVRHWRQAFYDDEHTRSRNRTLLLKAREAEPDNDRYGFYLANEMWITGQAYKKDGRDDWRQPFEMALSLYTDYVKRHNASDEGYQAQHRRAECKRQLGDHATAISYDLQAVRVRPKWPEAYCGIAESFAALGEWALCRDWADSCVLNATSQPQRESFISAEPLSQHYTPFQLRGLGRLHTADFKGALEDFKVCQAIWPNAGLERNIAITVELMERGKSKLRKRMFGKRPERSIAFVTRPLYEPWNAQTITEQGSGGSESCVLEVARRFAADGWRTAVFGTPGDRQEHVDEGIEWYASDQWHAQEPWHTVVSSRAPEVFDADLKAQRKILWMHDVNVGPMNEGPWGNRFDHPDAIVCLSRWHARHLEALYGPANYVHVPNGASLKDFYYYPSQMQRQPHSFIWGSSPDRGLEVLFDLWPDIRAKWDDAELHVFYGFAGIDNYLKLNYNPVMGYFRQEMQRKLSELQRDVGGIVWWDRQPRSQVAKVAATCTAWLYPTMFCETFCLTAVEMQAAGVIPLVSDLAALHETVSNPALRVTGHCGNVDYQTRFLDKLAAIVESSEEQKEVVRQEGREFAQTYEWDEIYDRYWKSLVLPTTVSGENREPATV